MTPSAQALIASVFSCIQVVENVLKSVKKAGAPGPADDQLVYRGEELPRWEQALIEAAWREWRDNASQRGQAPDAYEARAPRWFVNIELGFAVEYGPSLRWTCLTLDARNHAALKELAKFTPELVPDRVTYPVDFQGKRARTRRRR